MKRKLFVLISIFFVLIISSNVFADELYDYNNLELELNINGEFSLIPEKKSSSINKIDTKLLLFPEEDFRQEVLSVETKGTIVNKKVNFFWNDGIIEKKKYNFNTIIKTNNNRKMVRQKISFPLSDISGYEQYLKPTPTIDSDNPKIISKAAEIVEGETDLFKATFKLANWVEDNVVYDLNTLTASVSQQASWVLDNRQGVCDEMTSLFIAMARSVGIPARFVSGVSYTTSELFTENWQPHGWAEVYFPDVGWVSFDITFGEYGYIDVTHIKLRDSFDPSEPATTFEWSSNGVDLEPSKLSLNVNVNSKMGIIPEDVSISQKILSQKVGFGSYNLITAILTNNVDYYNAKTLTLSLPEEVKVIGRNKIKVLLAPRETKEIFWVIKIDDFLSENFYYKFPYNIYTEKNSFIQGSFISQDNENIYSKDEVEGLTITNGDRVYSDKISFDCKFPPEIHVNEEMQIACKIKNKGNVNLENIDFCLEEKCEKFDLLINQEKILLSNFMVDKIGWGKIAINAKNEKIEKKSYLQYKVLDDPLIEVNPIYPKKVRFGEDFTIFFEVLKRSFSEPKEIKIFIEGSDFESFWQAEMVKGIEQLDLNVEGKKLSSKNKYNLLITWEDEEGKKFSEKKEIVIEGEGLTFGENFKMFLNGILGWIS